MMCARSGSRRASSIPSWREYQAAPGACQGTLWTGVLATSAGVPIAMAADSLLALLAMLPVAVPLARRRHARSGGTGR